MSIDRRKFIGHTLKAGAFISTTTLLQACNFKNNKNSGNTIDQMELYRYDINIERHFSWGTWFNRQQVFIKLSCGDHYGWAETNGSINNLNLDLKEWGQFLEPLKGMDVYVAYAMIKANQRDGGKFNPVQLEFMEMALLDLIGRIEGKPAVDLLGLKGRESIPGLYCILSNDLADIEKSINSAIDQNLGSHVKFKMFGKDDLDLKIGRLARKNLGKDAFILSDVNRGYKNWKDLDELAGILIKLREAGLNAVEDPAELTVTQWKELQLKVGDLSLVPDLIMRPAWDGINRVEAGMGRYYNMHPDTMGSFHDLVPFGKKIKGFGDGIMIGDASLVGPACSAWQQVAIGLGASWVEALEKKEDSAEYFECIISKPTFRDAQGKFAMDPKPGFGVVLDEEKLKKVVNQVEVL